MRSKAILSGLTLLAVMVFGVSVKESEGASPLAVAQGSGIEDAVINVSSAVGKAVVSISTEHIPSPKKNKKIYFNAPFGQSPFGNDEFLRRFFDDFFGEMPERDYRSMGLGSGVIIDPKGYILTNEHVIANADKITVALSDGREFKAEVKGKDPRSDLTVIKINATNLTVAPLGDSDILRIGQWVVAIGNPFGFAMQSPEPTVTAGVVSALHRSLGRSLSRERDYSDLIQTDAAINPGNSGGPLVNLKGEIVGINVAIFSTSGGYQGIGFAIPINSAKRIISRLIEGKKIFYGWLGVTVQDLSEDLARHLGLADKNGALIANVISGGPAEKAGIKEGDVIKEFDAKKITNLKELLSLVGLAEVGRKVKVIVVREKKELALTVQIGERPENIDEEETEISSRPGEAKKWRGLEVTESKRGVVISDIEPGSAADEAELVAGEVILEIDKQPVKTLADYQRLTRAAKGDCLLKTSRGYFLLKGE